ncbi:hypothetical protein C8R47DRAFT_1229089 [Mycena vitilis]|nr:hypothetical protein C8R47DRAFT_1229089 [Mycena vitilis]
MLYYQLGGFKPSVYSFGPSESRFVEEVYEILRKEQHPDDNSSGLELVLGITCSGTSHLLLTEAERDAVEREFRGGSRSRVDRRINLKGKHRQKGLQEHVPVRSKGLHFMPTDFESVSAIRFAHIHELSAKLKSLRPKPKARSDNSPANKAFRDIAPGSNLCRGQFENSRVVYQVCKGNVDTTKFDLDDTSWAHSIRIFSLCYNTWASDTRPLQDRKNHPKVLDLGWCEANAPTLEGEPKMQRHIVIAENQHLSNFGNIDRYEYGATECCTVQVAARQIQAVFAKYVQPTAHPALLLVHDAETAMTVLRNLGVDVSQWDLQLKNLLRTQIVPRHSLMGEATAPRQYAPIYIIDIKTFFAALFASAGILRCFNLTDGVLAMNVGVFTSLLFASRGLLLITSS